MLTVPSDGSVASCPPSVCHSLQVVSMCLIPCVVSSASCGGCYQVWWETPQIKQILVEVFLLCLLSYRWDLEFVWNATTEVFNSFCSRRTSSVLQLSPLYLWLDVWCHWASARWEHHLVPFFPVAAQCLLVFLMPWGLLHLCYEGPKAGRRRAVSMERKIFSPFALAEEASQKQWGSL